MKRILTIFLCCLLIQCKIANHLPKINSSEKLNLNSIEAKIKTLSKSETGDFIKVTRTDTIFSFNRSSSSTGELRYSEEHVKTGEILQISGNNRTGYQKEVRNKKKSNLYIITYYGSGNVRSSMKMYSDLHLKGGKNVEYPMDRQRIFDVNGTLISSVDYDKIFAFNYKKLSVLLEQKDPKIKINRVRGKLSGDDSGVWDIDYTSPKNGSSNMEVDASSGKIIRDNHNLQTIE